MALTVEDGTGLAAADTYLTIADTDTYHTNFGSTVWNASTVTDAQKEVALRQATRHLDASYDWVGKIEQDSLQALDWPRKSAKDKENRDVSDSVPSQIEDATALLALEALSGELVKVKTRDDSIVKQKVDVIEVEFSGGAPTDKVFDLVTRTVDGLYVRIIGAGLTTKVIR